MEPTKPAPPKHKAGGSKITKYLPRATTFTVPSRPYSPGRASVAEAGSSRTYGQHQNQQPQQPSNGYPHHHHHHRSSFSGPITMIPPEARQRKPTSDPVEPTSPKVSCIGQVKRHKDAACRAATARKAADEQGKAANAKKRQAMAQAQSDAKHAQGKPTTTTTTSHKPPRFALMRLLRSKSSRSRTTRDQNEEEAIATGSTAAAAAAPPPLGQLRRFSSGRTALAGFDWRSANAAICPLDTPATDVESPLTKARPDDDDDDDDEDGNSGYYGLHKDADDDETCKIPHSAPMVLGGGGTAATQPTRSQQQVNLWKRRTMAPPTPLQLNTQINHAS